MEERFWFAMQDLNPLLLDPKSNALPIELIACMLLSAAHSNLGLKGGNARIRTGACMLKGG